MGDFGARTGGANIMEGTLEIIMGVLLATSIAGIFVIFPLHLRQNRPHDPLLSLTFYSHAKPWWPSSIQRI